MRPLRTLGLLLTMAALTAACAGASPGASQGGDQSQGTAPSQGAEPSQGGGGGGGGGPNGSITYQVSGDYQASGELAFIAAGASTFIEGGWQSAFFYSESNPNLVIQINSNPSSHIVNLGDGTVLVAGTVDLGCTFDYSQNDASGLVGTIDCPATFATNINTGATLNVSLHAEVNAHP